MRAGYRAQLILIVLLALITISVSANQLNTIQVSFINVDQGDSALIQDGDGFDVLIYGGRASVNGSLPAHMDGETLCGVGEPLQLKLLPGAVEVVTVKG